MKQSFGMMYQHYITPTPRYDSISSANDTVGSDFDVFMLTHNVQYI